MNLSTVIVLVTIVAVALVAYSTLSTPHPSTVPDEVLHRVLPAGLHQGESVYAPTSKFPNGLRSQHTVKIERVGRGVRATNSQTAYDIKSGEVAYVSTRYARFDYLGTHNLLYRSSQSFIDGQIVSSARGYAVSHGRNEIRFISDSTWHINGKEHDITHITITKLPDARFQTTITAKDGLHMSEIYTAAA